MTTLVVDAGTPRFLGILSVETGKYTPYWSGSVSEAIDRIYAADRVVTFNGDQYDFAKAGGFPELLNLPSTVVHIDMKPLAWAADQKFFGRGLHDIYILVFGALPLCPDTYEGDNHNDCYMTLKLFELWELGMLQARNN
jgi:hypothetical protein